jgi:hypothetical protein
MGIAGRIRVESDDITLVIDPVEGRRDRVRNVVQRGEFARGDIVDDAVRDVVDNVKADRNAIIVHSKEFGLTPALHVDGFEDAMVVQETVNETLVIGVESGDVAIVVDRRRNRATRPSGIRMRIIDVFRKRAGRDIVFLAVASTGRVEIESDRDIVVVDPY